LNIKDIPPLSEFLIDPKKIIPGDPNWDIEAVIFRMETLREGYKERFEQTTQPQIISHMYFIYNNVVLDLKKKFEIKKFEIDVEEELKVKMDNPFDPTGKYNGKDVYTDEDLIRVMRVSKPDIAIASIKTYVKNVKLYKILYDKKYGSELPDGTIENFDFLLPRDDYNPKDLVKHMPITSQRNYWNAILPVIKSTYIVFEKLDLEGAEVDLASVLKVEKYYGEAIKLINKIQKENDSKSIVSEKTKAKMTGATFEDVVNLVETLKEEGLFQDALILKLMAEYKFRNEVATLRLIKIDNYEKLTEKEKIDNNYVVLKADGKMFISRGDYKTDGTYGIIITEVEEESLHNDLTNYISGMTDDIFFKNTSGKQYKTSDISTRIGRLTKKHLKVSLGTSSITKLYMGTLDQKTLRALKKLSKDRGTSINVLLASYFYDP
jgi:hypothetical protein